MNSYIGTASLGFSIEVLATLANVQEPFINGLFGALGALVVKIVYDVIVCVIKKRKNKNVREK